MKRNRHHQNTLPFYYKIYNVSAVKMHKLSQHVGGCVTGIFTDTLIFSNAERVPELNKDIIGGIRATKISESDILLNTTPRTKNFINKKPEKKVLKKIDEFKLSDNNGCCILRMAGSGKSEKLRQRIKPRY
jgi:hypothetical protein